MCVCVCVCVCSFVVYRNANHLTSRRLKFKSHKQEDDSLINLTGTHRNPASFDVADENGEKYFTNHFLCTVMQQIWEDICENISCS